MTSWKVLHKLAIVVSLKTPKSLSAFELRRQKSSGNGPQNEKTSEHVWQSEKGLVISSWSFLLPIKNSTKIKLNF